MSSSINRRQFVASATFVAAAAVAGDVFSAGAAEAAPRTYTPDWDSVDQHPPAPEWFQDAKFGIYFHWGTFSVPAFDNEWYPRAMYQAGSSPNKHHIATYGQPSAWPYHNFIDGAKDLAGNTVKFAPKLKSAGGKFDPDEWVQLFVDAGARFAGPVAEHHDGFSMWDSRVNEWNSVDKGPGLDLLRLFSTAIRAKGLKLLVAMHHAYNFTGFYEFVPAQTDSSLKKLYGQLDSTAANQLWFDKLKEVVDRAQPDILWQDFNLDAVDERQRLNFLAYYYNQALGWGREVVATYKDGMNGKGEVFDYERGGPADLTTPYWLTDDSISSSSWCYTQGIGYYTIQQMLHSFIDRVSKNGNVLLNIAPMADGTIPQAQKDILLGIGDHLKRFGESVRDPRLDRVRRRSDEDGRRFVHHPARRYAPGHPLHPQQGQQRPVRHRPRLARQFAHDQDPRLGPDQPLLADLGEAPRHHRRQLHRPAHADPERLRPNDYLAVLRAVQRQRLRPEARLLRHDPRPAAARRRRRLHGRQLHRRLGCPHRG